LGQQKIKGLKKGQPFPKKWVNKKKGMEKIGEKNQRVKSPQFKPLINP